MKQSRLNRIARLYFATASDRLERITDGTPEARRHFRAMRWWLAMLGGLRSQPDAMLAALMTESPHVTR